MSVLNNSTLSQILHIEMKPVAEVAGGGIYIEGQGRTGRRQGIGEGASYYKQVASLCQIQTHRCLDCALFILRP